MKKFLPLLFPLLLLIPRGYSQMASAYVPDVSLSPEEFQARVLQPKSEIWVLDFWASWCGPCIEAAPYVREVQQRFVDKGVRFISLSWDDSLERWMAAMQRLKMPWQQLIVTQELKAFVDLKFPHKGIPAAFVIRTDGKVKRVAGIGMLESTIQKAVKASKK
jgi:thiol-disulfide isomerase/thioredoxin